MIQIKKVTGTEIPMLLPLIAAYRDFEGIDPISPERTASALEQLLQSPELGSAWFALHSSTVVGYLIGVYVFSLEHIGMTAEVDELFVRPASRHTGAGTALLSCAENEFSRVGCTNVSLQLSRTNDLAYGFYQRRGYGERPGFELLEKHLPADH
ncbi:MAG: GNAT family N-acetyltransferase [Burkholderiaceae bacterium]